MIEFCVYHIILTRQFSLKSSSRDQGESQPSWFSQLGSCSFSMKGHPVQGYLRITLEEESSAVRLCAKGVVTKSFPPPSDGTDGWTWD